MEDLPTDPNAKLAMLKRAYEIGTRIAQLAAVGAPVGPLRAYVAETPELTVEEGSGALILRHAGGVRWQIGIGLDDNVTGLGASGYGPLMTALGTDFSGAPYTPGNGE